MLKKGLFGGAIVLIAIVAGFIFLLRGCLSRYDERSAIPPALVFEKDGKSVVFTIIQYGKATSYSSGPRGTFKSLSTNYFIQVNDAATAAFISNKKIKHHSDVKFHPVKVMGASHNTAWVFMGELLAFDPFTLEKIADREIIQNVNPQLKGKMPDEERYYEYDRNSNSIVITATDGIKYQLSTTNLKVTVIEEDVFSKKPVEAKIKALKKQEEILNQQNREVYDRYRASNKLYQEKKISNAAYGDSSKLFNALQDSIRQWKDDIRNEISALDDLKDNDREIQSRIGLLTGGSISYPNMCTAVDTFNGKWYGLLSGEDLEKPDDRFRYRPVYTETARNKFYTASVTVKGPSGKTSYLITNEQEKLNDAVYLQGGFLLDKNSALPVHLKNDDGFIVCYKEKVGNTGGIMLSRIDLKGNPKWAMNTMLTEFEDWIFIKNKLVILGNDNTEISSSHVNLLLIIDLHTGKAVKYDYFNDKMRME
jgi:gas vesicle protein